MPRGIKNDVKELLKNVFSDGQLAWKTVSQQDRAGSPVAEAGVSKLRFEAIVSSSVRRVPAKGMGGGPVKKKPKSTPKDSPKNSPKNS